MSEFEAIIDLISSVVKFVIEKTIDLICVVFLTISCVLPWRIVEIINDPHLTHRNWREKSVVNFFLTLFDCFAVPISAISLASPLRWKQIYFIQQGYSYGRPWSTRWSLIIAGFAAIVDFVTFPLGLICLVFPIRFSIVWKSTYAYLLLAFGNSSIIVTDEEYGDLMLSLNWMWFNQFCNGIIDVLFIIPGL